MCVLRARAPAPLALSPVTSRVFSVVRTCCFPSLVTVIVNCITFTFTCPPSTSNAVHNFSLVTTTKCHWCLTLTLTLSLLHVHHHALMQFIQLRCTTLIIFCMHTIELYFELDLHCRGSWCQAGIRRVSRSCHLRTDGTTRFHLQS